MRIAHLSKAFCELHRAHKRQRIDSQQQNGTTPEVLQYNDTAASIFAASAADLTDICTPGPSKAPPHRRTAQCQPFFGWAPSQECRPSLSIIRVNKEPAFPPLPPPPWSLSIPPPSPSLLITRVNKEPAPPSTLVFVDSSPGRDDGRPQWFKEEEATPSNEENGARGSGMRSRTSVGKRQSSAPVDGCTWSRGAGVHSWNRDAEAV